MKFKVLTFNVHKFRHPLFRKYLLKELKTELKKQDLHLVCLQELIGIHPIKQKEDFDKDPLEHLADEIWTHFAYGKNAVYPKGHHGNAILSYYPINIYSNYNVSNHAWEQRGILHAEILIDNLYPLDIFTLHFDLSEWGRQKQVTELLRILDPFLKNNRPVIVTGDFNDWRLQSHKRLLVSGLQECAMIRSAKLQPTFPSVYPFLALDRIYYSGGLKCVDTKVLPEKEWRHMSDHLPLYAEFEYDPLSKSSEEG
ncbi:MAG: endonuclease/exonuclease/phosphatase family protein [Bdellovibrionales bacterium]|nr:endonuclease/exonuclease/phosphatase family protein [Bdellovibrionales bacterium]